MLSFYFAIVFTGLMMIGAIGSLYTKNPAMAAIYKLMMFFGTVALVISTVIGLALLF